jgi:ABC-type transporter Mla subunit MlaD
MTPMTWRQWVLVVLILVVCAAAVVAATLLLATGQTHPVRPLTP